jgi:hypothetical protein
MGINAAHPPPFIMHLKHHRNRLGTLHAKNRFQNLYHEIHGGVIVIEQENPEQRGWLHPGNFGLKTGASLSNNLGHGSKYLFSQRNSADMGIALTQINYLTFATVFA